jgi:hypothetical protein
VALMLGAEIEDNREPKTAQQTQSQFGQAFLEALQAEQFSVVDKLHADAKRDQKVEIGKLRDVDGVTLKQWMGEEAVEIYVVGSARAIGPIRHDRVPGQVRFDWQADAAVRMEWAESGEVIATLSELSQRKDSKDPNGGRDAALHAAGQALGKRFLDQVFAQMAVWAFEGRRVTVEVQGCGARHADAVEAVLDALESDGAIQDLRTQIAGGSLCADMRTKASTRALEKALRGTKLEGASLAVDARGRHVLKLIVTP